MAASAATAARSLTAPSASSCGTPGPRTSSTTPRSGTSSWPPDLSSAHRVGLEIGRHGDLQHFKILGVIDLLVLDSRRLVDGRAGHELVLAMALIFEDR